MRGSTPDAPGRRLQRAHLALLAALCVPVFFWGLGRYGLVNADEAIYQGIAEHMVASGDWLHLDFRGEPRFYDSFLNAPLHYWLRAALISLFGSNGWTLRILSALSGAGTVLVSAGLAARLRGPRAGLFAGLALLTTFQFVYLHGARTGELDALCSLCLVSLCWLFLCGVEDGRSFVPHHLVLCALLWTKAPLVLVPLAVELGHFALVRNARPRLRAYLTSGLALAPLALSWHLLQLALWWDRVPEVATTFWSQATGARTDGEYAGRAANAAFYLRTLAWGAFPWSAALPFAIDAALSDRRLRALCAWPAALLAFFTLVAKHYPWYVQPAYPFFAVLLAAWLSALPRAAPARLALAAAVAAAALVCVDASPANPFAEVALTYPMQARLRGLHGLPVEGTALAAALLAGCVAFIAARSGPRGRRVAAAALGLALLAAAAVRVARPLGQLDHVSELERLRAQLDLARAEGRALAYPIRLPPGSVQIARYLYAEDYEIEARVRPLYGTSLWLYPKGDPAVLDHSIGRLGLEHRLARGGGAAPPLPEER